MKKRIILLATIAIMAMAQTTRAQSFALKTNIISDALLNINAGAEVGLAPKWTFNLSGQFNGWTLSDDKRWKHWAAQPEFRYWFCDRFGGHFIGIHAHGGQYNIGGFDGKLHFLGTDMRKLADSRYQGWFAGGGINYGYAWVLSHHWNLEAELGFGYSYTQFDRYECAGCGKKVEEKQPHHYVGPTKAAVNLVYVF